MSETIVAITSGLIIGFVGNIPALLLCRAARKRSYANMLAGAAVLFVSFLFFTVALLAAFKFLPEKFLPFSIACIASFLLTFIVEAILIFRWMSATQKKLEQKRLEGRMLEQKKLDAKMQEQQRLQQK